MRKTLEERFWAKVDRRGDNECWNWAGPVRGSTTKYGYLYYEGHYPQAHRLAYSLANQVTVARNIEVCHTCDNGLCCNPQHLFTGTHRDNMRDKAEKGRSHNGTSWKLTKAQVWDILALYYDLKFTYSDIAANFGITKPMVSGIVHGRYHPEVLMQFRENARKQAA